MMYDVSRKIVEMSLVLQNLALVAALNHYLIER